PDHRASLRAPRHHQADAGQAHQGRPDQGDQAGRRPQLARPRAALLHRGVREAAAHVPRGSGGVNEIQPSGAASPFDAIKRVDEAGEYWSARELMPLLGYRKWEKFEDSIERARVSIANTGMDPDAEASRRREAYGRTRQVGANYRLTRHGAFITA